MAKKTLTYDGLKTLVTAIRNYVSKYVKSLTNEINSAQDDILAIKQEDISAYSSDATVRQTRKAWLSDFMEGYDGGDGTAGDVEGERVRSAVEKFSAEVYKPTSLTNLPATKTNVFIQIKADQELSFASLPAAGTEIKILVQNASGSQRGIDLPMTYRRPDETIYIPALGFCVIRVHSSGVQGFIEVYKP